MTITLVYNLQLKMIAKHTQHQLTGKDSVHTGSIESNPRLTTYR